MASPIEIPDAQVLVNLDELLRTRDAVVASWEKGVFPSELAALYLRSLRTYDAYGDTWMLRPTESGAVLIRVDRDASADVANPRDFVPVRRPMTSAAKAAAAFAGLLWAAVIVSIAF